MKPHRQPQHIGHEQPVSYQEAIVEYCRDENSESQAPASICVGIRLELPLYFRRKGDYTFPQQAHMGLDSLQAQRRVRHSDLPAINLQPAL